MICIYDDEDEDNLKEMIFATAPDTLTCMIVVFAEDVIIICIFPFVAIDKFIL